MLFQNSSCCALALIILAAFGCTSTDEPVTQHRASKMSKTDAAADGVVTLPSAHNAEKTVERLKKLLAEKGIQLFAHIDHAAAAKQVGMSLRPTQVLIFGNPKAGTPLMQSRQTIGLDLPLRALIWEDEKGKVWLTYTRLEILAQRHQLADRKEAIQALDAGLAALAREAAAP
jgi:uncharacterized protein (DUF302 family)